MLSLPVCISLYEEATGGFLQILKDGGGESSARRALSWLACGEGGERLRVTVLNSPIAQTGDGRSLPETLHGAVIRRMGSCRCSGIQTAC